MPRVKGEGGVGSPLGPADIERIREAVRRAERAISGEIVPCVVLHSDSYPEAAWMAGAAAALLACLALFLLDLRSPLWQPLGELILWVPAAGLLGGFLGGRLPPLRRWLVGRERLSEAVHRRAREAFTRHEVFRTKERTGVLLFVSLFERLVVVVGDSGINAKVRQEDWDEAVSCVLKGGREDRLADGIVAAVAHCHDLLLKAGFKASAGDVNELPDKPRLGEQGS